PSGRWRTTGSRTAPRSTTSAAEAARGPALAPDATVSEAIEAVARSGDPARVMDHGRCLGVVDSAALLGVVAGADTPASGAPDGPRGEAA
ncbi:hypothetical protein ACFWIZ_44830, partial [Streptomyces sp. NPDC127044]